MRLSHTLMLSAAMVATWAGAAVADWNPGDPFKMHYPQLPDPLGIDMDFRQLAGNPTQRMLADDWLCTQSGPVSDIHFWYSFRSDFFGQDALTAISQVNVGIYSNALGPPSTPNVLLWSRSFPAALLHARLYGTGTQSYADPTFQQFTPNNHQLYYQMNLTNIDAPFIQTVGTTYWLALQVVVPNSDVGAGWKTSGSPQFQDTMVFRNAAGGWTPVFDPRIPTAAVPIDLAFVITPTPGAGALLALGGLVALRRRR